VRAWRSPFGRRSHVAVLTRAERCFIRLGEDFDVAQVLNGTHWGSRAMPRIRPFGPRRVSFKASAQHGQDVLPGPKQEVSSCMPA
jgi:hypothetical protein